MVALCCQNCIDAHERSDTPKCPACLGVVNRGASKCVNCGSDLPEQELVVDFEWETEYSLEVKRRQQEEEGKKGWTFY